MTLKCGIIGLPNIGKSTIFNCISNVKAQVANFPFSTIKPNVGIISVPDERLTKLAILVATTKIIPATIEIIDIAGLVKGASNGEGLGNKFLSNILETDAIIHVLRCFDNDKITHVNGYINPIQDKKIVDHELQMKDLETIKSRILKIKKQTKHIVNKKVELQLEVLLKYEEILKNGKSARTIKFYEEDKSKIAKDLNLLTIKPIIYVCNIDEHTTIKNNKYIKAINKVIEREKSELLVIDAKIESEIAEFETYEERLFFLNELGLKESGISRLIRSAYRLLSLETFFTVGKKEIRSWPFLKGSTALQCAGIIHSDFKKGFIRVEVIKYIDFIKLGSENICKESGKIYVEGKNYIVQDGDIMHFRFNV
ncbi:MAG: redox-regulated ATPase YchF [Bacteroidales bacterium OttesenSCG-928-I14]|jgi:GTP-binding protein YchF|nr:redox-regulated ATPase YchF [Bacteroidales bacterium OttesenSCG-928-I14]